MTAGESEFDGRPARTSATLAVVVGALALPIVTLAAPVTAALAAAGVALLAAGTFRGRVAAITAGAAIELLAVLVGASAASEALTFPLVLAAAASIVAWDLGEYAVVLGRQVGRAARTQHAEVTHAALSLVVFGVAAFAVDAVSLVAGDGRPVVALVALLAGTLVLLRAFR